MESDDEFDMLPVKRRGAPIVNVNNGLDTKFAKVPADNTLDLNGGIEDDVLPVKRRGPPVTSNGFGNDPFNNLPKVPDIRPDISNDSGQDVLPTNGNNGFYNDHFDNPQNGILPKDLNRVVVSPPVKRRGAPVKVSNGDSFLKHRSEPEKVDKLGDDPFDNISITVGGHGSPKIPNVDSIGINQSVVNSNEANNNGLSDVLQNEMMYNPLVNEFDRMGLKESSKNIYSISSVDDFSDASTVMYSADDQSDDYLLCQEPVSRKPKGVSFDIRKNDEITSEFSTNYDCPTSDDIGKQMLGDNFDKMFQPMDPTDFIDGLDFLEQCGGNDNDAMEQLQRKSLYVRFDPLCETQDTANLIARSIADEHICTNKPVASDSDTNPVKQIPFLDQQLSTTTKISSSENLLQNSFDDAFSPSVLPTKNLPNENLLHQGSLDDPFSPIIHVSSKADNDLKELYSTTKPDLNSTGLVEPLLYTQSDMDEVIKKAKCDLDDDVSAREMDWKKKYEELECKIKEEVAMRELIEQDYRGKIDCLRKDNVDMKEVLSHYERTIVELTENSHHDTKSNEETLAETIRAKEQLQEDINSAEQNLFDAYKRIEKLKQTIDSYKRNEEDLKENNADLHVKLQKSEERYNKLREHVTEKIDGANTLISKVRKQQEVDLLGLQAALKKAQNRVNNLELEIQQKNIENQQLSQICDDLIKKVSGE